MSHVVVIGCGVVGAAIAYELSLVPGVKITVLDQQPPAQAATKAALGVLMGIISHKTKGKAWQMRQASIQRYETLIPELEAVTGHKIPFNQQGILMLLPEKESGNTEDIANWQQLAEIRASQGWQLEIWDGAKLKSSCPQLNCQQIQAAVYSPQDRQVDPVSLTLALVEAAKRNGVTFHFGVTATGYDLSLTPDSQNLIRHIKTTSVEAVEQSPQIQNVGWLVVSAGLGSLQALDSLRSSFVGLDLARGEWESGRVGENTNILPAPSISPSPSPLDWGQILDIRPVLGQAIHLKLSQPLGNPDFQPVITGNDVHIVPCGGGKQATEYWVGATVEFPPARGDVVAEPARLEQVMQQAIALCPALAEATVVRTWSGLRPRPEGRPAPIIGDLPGFSNVLLATGHYRNGVLLAPATAQIIRQLILDFRF
jgi:glycine/D-amino acid oxidase-like deaminating enzyme